MLRPSGHAAFVYSGEQLIALMPALWPDQLIYQLNSGEEHTRDAEKGSKVEGWEEGRERTGLWRGEDVSPPCCYGKCTVSLHQNGQANGANVEPHGVLGSDVFQSVCLHDTQENRITGLVWLWTDACIHLSLTKIGPDRISHSRIKTPRLFDW